ncbi:uncharacterized protein UTRI_10106 [Ustilago trichophora]|uniref:Uncharacterized protein n=1 Tax=Ustilago trichophora TaxID=86804 RepID=A0A5C3E5C5_9BASI|nr:uncharacterized protein UTRI_10106 [Ustilago trichophora]
MEDREYMPRLQKEFQPRAGIKPLIVQQPEGPSLTVNVKSIEWQGCQFRISWTAPEGPSCMIYSSRITPSSTDSPSSSACALEI